MAALELFVALLRALVASRAALAAENLALRHQLTVLHRSVKRPRPRRRDRVFWVWLSRLWHGWRSCLIVVKPETVVRWHGRGFKLYWRWKSRKKTGRPLIDAEVRQLIRRMCRENPLWGAPRIQSELVLLGHGVAESTVAKYMVRGHKPPSPDMANLPEKPHRSTGLGRLLHGSYRDVSCAVLLPGATSRPAPRGPLQRDGASHGRMDGAADRASVSLRGGAAFLEPRPRWHLRGGRATPHPQHGHRGSADRATQSVAESVLRATCGLHSSRVSGPRHRLQRRPPQESPCRCTSSTTTRAARTCRWIGTPRSHE